MLILRRFLYLAVGALLWHDAARGQSPAEYGAAQETGLSGLRLVNPRHVDARLSLWGIRFGYVENDARLGSTSRYSCGGLSPDRAIGAAQPVSAALARLPYVSVRKLALRYLILCGGAKRYDRPIGGIPVPPLDLLMLDIGFTGDPYLEKATLHELYHMAELRINMLQDPDWDRQFTGYVNEYAPGPVGSAVGSGTAGFVTEYAQSFPHEDRAELFANLVLKPGEVLAHIRASGDSVLRRKVLFMDEKSQSLLGHKLVSDGP